MTCLQAVAPTAASSRNSLPALNAAGVVQVKSPYSVSGADGRERYSGVGKCQGSGGNNSAAVAIRKALRADGCRSPRAPLFLPPGFAGSAGQRGGRKDLCRMFFQRSKKPSLAQESRLSTFAQVVA